VILLFAIPVQILQKDLLLEFAPTMLFQEQVLMLINVCLLMPMVIVRNVTGDTEELTVLNAMKLIQHLLVLLATIVVQIRHLMILVDVEKEEI
jgi:hypothetical protein